MRKTAAAIIGGILLIGGVGVAIAHYLIESSFTSKYVTLAIAAVLLVAGWALFDWGVSVTRRWQGDDSKENKPKA